MKKISKKYLIRFVSRGFEFLAGLLFGLGLLLSGMTDPGKVVGFLDLFGVWDPSLAFVMGGAILVGAIAFAFVKKCSMTLLGGDLHIPKTRVINKRLVVGSLCFGVGWGLAGFCPGPALVAMANGVLPALLFVAAMIVGMLIFEFAEKRSRNN